MSERVRKPEWLKISIGANERYTETKRIVESHCLHTICSSGRCPNMGRMLGKRYGHFYDRRRYLYPLLQVLQYTNRQAHAA